jgi:hypothetical protein
MLCAFLVCGGLRLMAADPFTGTWKVDLSKAKFSQKPIKVEVANGTYKCLTCDPPITVKADGTDQPVSGQPGFDTFNVRVTDDHHLEAVAKKAGKVAFEEKLAVAPDGMTATEDFVTHPPSSDKPVTGSETLKRVGNPVPGSIFSGSWVMDKAQDMSDNGTVFTFEQSGDSLKMSDPTGAGYAAKVDGKEYPYKGSAETDHVVLKRIDARTIEETDKGGGKVLSTSRMTVSPDGRTLTMVAHDKSGRITTLIWNKQ